MNVKRGQVGYYLFKPVVVLMNTGTVIRCMSQDGERHNVSQGDWNKASTEDQQWFEWVDTDNLPDW